ncbi:SH3 domain-containing protein [Fodinicola acaciae]|uniref:SH3 domain-containing protein n=1 Tax=Fodinicola acaciae TaxID=2681555 RepID=UPI0013D8C4A9|nr:SH3 domain-containing protein [Fodinicola acaciae]
MRGTRILAALALAATAVVGAATPADAAPTSPAWHENLAAPVAGQVNLASRAGTLTIADPAFRTAAAGGNQSYGMEILPPRTLAQPANQVSVKLAGKVPAGSDATVDVRASDGQQWTSWQDAKNAALDRPATQLQLRITMHSNANGAAPALSGLDVSTSVVDRKPVAKPMAALSYRVYATREGLVGGTTANGHVIVSNDHFVALPSGKNLSPKGSTQYSVKVCGPTRCETAPVWDVGPWNTKDDYWNPSSTRQMWKDLPQGTPEAQAAYLNGYNGGKDQFGRRVLNPAGIDLADGTFYNVGLNDNGYVTVTFLWTSGGGTGTITGTVKTAGDPLNVRSGPHTTDSVVGSVANGSNVTITCQTHGTSVTGTYGTSDLWDKISSPVGYVADAYVYTGADGQVAPNC